MKKIEKLKNILTSKNKKSIALLGMTALLAVGGVVAAFTATTTIVNSFSTGAPSIELIEDFNPADSWLPGENKKKEVKFKNTGSYECLLRFKVEVTLNKPNSTTAEEEIPDNFYKLHWAWDDKNRNPKVDNNWNFASTDWENGTWYYYNKVLKPGEDTNLTLISVEFTPHISNDTHRTDYTDYTLHVKVTGEAVPVPKDGEAIPEDNWMEPTVNHDNNTVIWSDAKPSTTTP